VLIEGVLELPANPVGMVVFAHSSGSSRLSTRNNDVANALRSANIGTLLLDLLTAKEDEDTRLRFDIALLTERLTAAADWLGHYADVKFLPLVCSVPVPARRRPCNWLRRASRYG
jgi:putative phosphoribosyl transferase